MKRAIFVVVLCIAVASTAGFETPNPVTWVLSKTGPSRPSDLEVELVANVQRGWHMYAMQGNTGGAVHLALTVPDSSAFAIVQPISASDPVLMQNIDTNGKLFAVYEGTATFTVLLKRKTIGGNSPEKFELDVRYQACSDTLCLPPKRVSLTLSL